MSTRFGAAVAAVLGVMILVLGAASLRCRWSDAAAKVRGRLWGSDRRGAPAWFGQVVGRAELGWDIDVAWLWARRGAVTTGLVVAYAAPVAGVVVLAGAALVRTARPWFARRRAAAACTASLPGVLDLLSASMASGSSLAQAISAVADRSDALGQDLAVVAARHQRGTPLQEALDGWAFRRKGTGAELVADALALAGASGGSQAQALRGVGDTLREREALAREVRALASQAQMSAWVLVVTPVGFAFAVASLDARVGSFLFATPLGLACLAIGLGLDLAGAWWMRKLVGRIA